MTSTARRIVPVLGAVATLTLSAAVVPAASVQAAEVLFADPDDTLGADIRRVRVVNDGGDLSIRIRFDRIVKDGRARSQALQVFVDTDRGRPGPELQLATGLNSGMDWWLREMKSWTKRGALARCNHDVDIDWARDRVVVELAAECLDDVSAPVRISLKAGEWTRAAGTRTDWFPARRSFSAQIPPR